MSTSTSALFTGGSKFSQDLSGVISRAVGIASLPLTMMKNDVSALEAQADALTGLDGRFKDLQTAVEGIAGALGGSAFETEISDDSLVGATVSDGAVEGVYSIQILDAGAYSTAMTSTPFVSTGEHSYQVKIGDDTYDVNPANSSAGALAAAINAAAGARVRAVAVNVGPGADQGYRISLQATALGPVDISILDNGAAMAQTYTVGREASYIVNGSGKTVASDSRQVNIAEGLTLNLLAAD